MDGWTLSISAFDYSIINQRLVIARKLHMHCKNANVGQTINQWQHGLLLGEK
jgi:hypothetical protein